MSALAGAVGCGGSDGGDNTTTGTAGTLATAGTTGGVAGNTGSTAGTMSTAGTGNTAGTINTGTSGTTAGDGAAGTGDTGCVGTDAECNVCKDTAEGIYAMKVELDVWWMDEVNDPATPLADPGRGKLNIYFRGEIKEVDKTEGSANYGKGKGIMHPCGTELPTILASANCTAIQIEFPTAMWDKDMIPEYETGGSTTGFGVGDVLTVAKTYGLLGLQLNDGAQFPSYMDTLKFPCPAGTGEQCFPDHDEDGKPGVTVTFKKDKSEIVGPFACNGFTPKWTHFGAPLSLLDSLDPNTGYAESGQIGLATELGGSGKIKEGCASGVGVSDTGEGLPSRVLHCQRVNGTACTSVQEGFIDQNTPNFHILQKDEIPTGVMVDGKMRAWKHNVAENDPKLDRSPSKGPRSSVIRLGDLGSSHACQAIRDTAFLPFE